MSSRRSNRHDDTRGAGAEADLGAAQTTIPRFLLVLVLVLFSPPTFSQEPASGTEARQEPEPALDAHHMTGFLDGMIGAQLREHAVAGAVAAVVHRGEVVHLEGYGYADVDAREPVDPEQTLFRIGSVTKLFTFTAVMQLLEAGRLTGCAVALTLPVLGAVAIFTAAAATATLWWGRSGSRWLRVRYSAAVAIGLLFVWSLNYWNLLGWRM